MTWSNRLPLAGATVSDKITHQSKFDLVEVRCHVTQIIPIESPNRQMETNISPHSPSEER
jgi:hypothetical protein